MILRYTPRSISRSKAYIHCSIRHASTSTITPQTQSQIGPTDPASSVRSMLEQLDRPSILASEFYPKDLRQSYLAIRAFNAELAKIADTTSNELMARMRIAWWRDGVQGIFNGKVPRHPTMLALADAIKQGGGGGGGGLVLDHFISICDAREADLTSNILTIDEIERYAERTSSRLYYLSLNLLGVSNPIVDEIFSHLGKARGITLTLASFPFHAGVIRSTTSPNEQQQQEGVVGKPATTVRPRQRRLVLPQEFLGGLIEEEVYRKGSEAKGLRDAVFATATRANDYTISAQTLLRKHQKEIQPSFNLLLGPLVESQWSKTFLRELEKRDFDIFDTRLINVAKGQGWHLPWNMWKAGIFGRV